jgi:hypothetical protein
VTNPQDPRCPCLPTGLPTSRLVRRLVPGSARPTPIPIPPGPCGPFTCTGFTEFPSNPVYDPPPPQIAFYQTVRFDPAGFTPFGPTAFYKMWYDIVGDTVEGGGIDTATSPDGITWSFLASTTGLVPAARHSRVLFDRSNFAGLGAPYRIWYWDSSFFSVDPLAPSVLLPLRTASSLDGVNWFGDTVLMQDTSSPLVTPFFSTYYQCYGPADVLFFKGNPPILDPSTPFNNRYVMYYNTSDGFFEEISLAVSADGYFWTQVGPVPVLPRGGPGTWDENKATEHAVILRLAPNRFFMLYSGGIEANTEGIGCAESTDGINWTKFPGNPILSINDGVAWRSARTQNPWVLFDPNRFSGHGDASCFKLWLTGAPASNPDDINIGYGTQS